MQAALQRAADLVAAQLGADHREAVYQRALAAELRATGCVVAVEAPVVVSYVASDGFSCPVAAERADMVVDGKAVVELKVGAADGAPQARRYARALGLAQAWVVAFRRDAAAEVTQALPLYPPAPAPPP